MPVRVTADHALPRGAVPSTSVKSGVSTKADPGATGWAIRDPVISVRLRGHERSWPLDVAARSVAGTATECAIHLPDGDGVSRTHAAFERDGDTILVSDLGSTNGTRQDGEDRASFALSPGMEVELGRTRLIAESRRSLLLRDLLRRLIGAHPTKLPHVDDALQSVRQMAHLRSCLVIHGAGSMAGTARRLHRLVLGDDRPLSIHARRESGVVAVDRARDGMLFLDAEHLPADLHHVLVSFRLPEWRTRLVIGAENDKVASQLATKIPSIASFAIPPLAARADDLEPLLLAYANDAVAELHAPGTGLRPHDLQWIREHGVETLEDIDELMTRLVAVRNWGVSGGATRVGQTHGALSKYLRRRNIPT